MHVLMTNFHGNPNVGLYGFANDKYCLLGKEVPQHQAQEIAKALGLSIKTVENTLVRAMKKFDPKVSRGELIRLWTLAEIR